MGTEKIAEKLALHEMYLKGEPEGVKANLRGADLRGANLREANLYGADLREANLYGADLREADLREANLYEANLREANLYEANLREANLYEANLRGAKGIIKIENQYQYQAFGYFHKNQKRVVLGCHNRTIEEWDADFNNNPREFPEGTPQYINRLFIKNAIKEWLNENYIGVENGNEPHNH